MLSPEIQTPLRADATCHWTSHTGQTYRTHPHGHLAPRRD
jgi:hypothetical protein